MAGKAPVFASTALYCALDNLTKNQLIDLVCDMQRGESGADATDVDLLAAIQERMEVVWAYRKDRRLCLKDHYDSAVRYYEKRKQLEVSNDVQS